MGNVGDIPVRKVVKRSTVRVVGYHASRKMRRLVPWESQIERDYFEWLEVDPCVKEFYAQPKTFQFKNFRYTPDAFVITHQGNFFAEIKPDDVLEDLEVMARIEEAKAELRACGIDLTLVLENQIREPALKSNVERLLRYVRRQESHDDVSSIALALYNGPLSISDLAVQAQIEIEFVFQCIAQGFVCVNLHQEITPQTFVSGTMEQLYGTRESRDWYED